MKKRQASLRVRPQFEELEPRILYSADAAALLHPDAITNSAEVRVLDLSSSSTNSSPTVQTSNTKSEIVFVDTRVNNYLQLVDDISAQNSASRHIEVKLLNSNQDGIQQITNTLAGLTDISAIHLIGEGNVAELHLGSSFITQDSIENTYANALQKIGQSLSADADILIYGCNFGQGTAGETAVATLANITGADVAASIDRTGNAADFGNWTLEYNYGQISTDVVISAWGQKNWFGALSTFTVINSNDSGAGSLRQAITDANNTAGTDSIAFNIAVAGTHTINLTSALPMISTAMTIDGTTQTGYTGTPLIFINGASAGATDGIDITASNVTVKGLGLYGFNATNYDTIFISGTISNIVLQSNYIGINAAGTVVGNYDGITFSGATTNSLVGGTNAGEGNVITGSTGRDGIAIINSASNGIAILGNSIYGNTLQGINLGTSGVTANDSGDGDTGFNNLQNFPVLSSATTNGSSINILGTLNSNASSYYRIEFFANVAQDVTGYGEGQRFLGFANVTTDGVGNATIIASLTASVAAGEFVSATATKSDATFTTFTDTSEFAQNVTALIPATYAISGTIYEDVNGNGVLADDGVGSAGVVVTLYQDNGNGTIDGGDTFVASSMTDAAGNYTFAGQSDAIYWVVVDSKTVTPSAGYNGGYGQTDVWAEQTYGSTGAVSYNATYNYLGVEGALFGGVQGTVSDDATALSTAEHVTRVIVSGTNVNNVNSGFSFNVVTNVRGGDATDDNLAANRTVQGSLRQFIQNANAISGSNVMRFLPTTTTNATDGAGNTWWRLDVTNVLPSLTDSGTTLDGIAYSASNGTTVLDTNVGQVGTGGTVGVDGLTLDRVNRPELEVAGSALNAPGITVDAASGTVRNLAIDSFVQNGGTVYSGAQLRITSAATNAGGGVLVSNNLIGMHADGTNPGMAQVFGININGAAMVTNNFIAFVNGNGVMLSDAWMGQPNTQSVTFTDNEMAFIGDLASGSGDTLSDISNGAVIRGNYLHDFVGNQPVRPFAGKGIEVWYQTQNVLIENNTIANMRTAGIGINDGSQNIIIRRNIITGTTGDGTYGGAGILITSFNDTAISPPSGNQITENSIYGNAGLGIDIDSGTITALSYGDGVTANDGGDADAGGNGLQNFPVLSAAATSGNKITINGSLNSSADSYFLIEFFSNVTADSSGHGEGQRFLGFANVMTDSAGNATISKTLSATVAVGEFITATATKSNATFTTFADTSEFAQDLTATATLIATNLSAAETYTEDTTLNLTDIVVDTTSATVTAILTLSDAAAGSLNTATSGSVTSTFAAGVWAASGAAANVNTLLAGLTFTPSLNFNGNFTITTNVSDGVAAPITGTKAISGTAVNDAPVEVFTGANFTGVYAYNDASGNWFVQNTPVDTGTIQSKPQGAALHLSDSAGGGSSSGVIVYFDGSLKLGDLLGGSFASTGNTLTMNIYLDTGNDGQFFSFNGAQFTGLNGDSYGNVTLGPNGGAFNDNTVFTKADGTAALTSTFTLAQLKAGAVAGIDDNTRVALWIGGGNAFSSDISNISLAATTTNSLTVAEDSGLTSLGLDSLAFGPGGGADEASQMLTYMVTALPGAALGNVVLADGLTLVSTSISYSLAQIQGMQFQSTANANGGPVTFSFDVKDSGNTLNGGVDTITKTLTINVIPVNDAPVTSAVTLTTIAEDSGVRLITQAELLANASDVDGPGLSATGLIIASGAGSLVDNGDGTWTYTPLLNDDTAVTFSYSVTDGSLSALGSANLDITPLNDAPSGVTASLFASINEDEFNNAGKLVSDFTASTTDPDTGSLKGVAIYGADNSNGQWQYTVDGGSNWVNVGTVSANNSLLLASDALTRVRFVPNANYNGLVFPFSYRAWDQTSGVIGGYADSSTNGGSSSFSTNAASVSIAMSPVNDAPVLTPYGPSYNTAEGAAPVTTTVATVLSSSVTDVDTAAVQGLAIYSISGAGGLLEYSINGGSSWLTVGSVSSTNALLLRANDLLRFTPDNVNGGTMLIDYRAWDQTAGITGTKVNASITGSTSEFSVANDRVTVNTSSVNNAPTAIIIPTNYSATEQILLTLHGTGLSIADVDAGSAMIRATITVISGTLNAGAGTTGVTISGSGSTNITLVGSTTQINDLLSGNLGSTVTYIINSDTPPATDTLTLTVDDLGNTGFGGALIGTDSATIDITPVNDAAIITSATANLIETNAPLTTSGILVISDVDSAATFAAQTNAAGSNSYGVFNLASDGSWTYNANTAHNEFLDGTTYTDNLIVTSADGTSSTITVNILGTNDAPTASNVSLNVLEDNVLNDLLPIATDAEGATVTYSLGSPATHGSVTVGANGAFSYNPNIHYNGADSFTYTIDDGNGGTNTYTVSINVISVNNNPTASNASINAIEDTLYSGTLPTATDVESDPIIYSLNTGTLHGTVNVNANGDFTYAPSANYNGADSFTYTVTDSLGGANTYTISIAIAAVNDAPLASDDSVTGLEDNNIAGNVLTNDFDVENSALTAILVNGPANGTLTLNANGSFIYTPNANWNGTDTFTYKANDGSVDSNNASVTINVTPQNDAPTTSPVTLAAIAEDSGAHLITQAQLLTNALDVDGDTLVVTNLAIATGNGVLVNNLNGTWTYTPASNDDTAVSFSYNVTDGSLIAAGLADLDLTPVNDAPIDANLNISTLENTTFTGNLPVATDIEGDAITYSLNTGASHGSVSVNTSGSFTYTPAPFYSGTDSFTYAIDDGNGGSNTYTVTINSVNINDAPTASDANINAVEDIVYSGILPVATDLDLNQITYTLNTGALHGTVNVNANGDFTYTPTANYNGADNFTYTVSDGLGGSNTYTISINIAAVNDLPVANNDNITGLEDNSVTGNVLTNDSDLESPTLNAVVVSGPANGILTLNSNGSFTYTPNANWNGTETFTYKANDGTDNSNVATVTIAITPINDAPNNSAVTLPTILKDSGAHLITQAQLLANALDVDGDALTAINLAISVGNGVLVDNTNGTWTYTPGAKDESLVTFSYTVTDGTLIAAGTAKMDIVPVIAPIVPTPTPITPIIVDPITITPTPKPITTDPSTPTDFNPINKPSATNQATPQIASAINNNQNIIVNLDSNAIKNTNSLASRLNQQDAPFSILDLINLPSTSVANDLTEIFSSLTHNAQIQINAIEFAESKSSPAQLIGKIFFDNKIALTSVAVSAGLVAWAAQYGILFSSVLATLPAWRNLDPVAILGKVDDDDTEWDISEDENDQAAEENAIEILSEKAT